MGEKDDGVEERWVGSRLFRRMSDGQIVEVGADGSIEHDFELGGRSFDSQTASFHSMQNARREEPAAEPEPSGPVGADGEPVAVPGDLTMQEKMRQYLNRDRKSSDTRFAGMKQASQVTFQGSVKAMLDDAPKASTLGGSHGLSRPTGMAGATGVVSTKVDPFRKLLADRKATTYTEGKSKMVKDFYTDSSTKMGNTPKSKYRFLRGR